MVIPVLMACDFMTYHITVHPKKYAHGSHSVAFHCGLEWVNFANILQDYFPGTREILEYPKYRSAPLTQNISILISFNIIQYHAHISQMSPQLSWYDTCQNECELKNLTYNFLYQNFSLMKKLMNKAIVTLTPKPCV